MIAVDGTPTGKHNFTSGIAILHGKGDSSNSLVQCQRCLQLDQSDIKGSDSAVKLCE